MSLPRPGSGAFELPSASSSHRSMCAASMRISARASWISWVGTGHLHSRRTYHRHGSSSHSKCSTSHAFSTSPTRGGSVISHERMSGCQPSSVGSM